MSKSKQYIIQMIPSDGGTTRSVVVSRFWMRFTFIFSILFLCIFTWLTYQAFIMSNQLEQSEYITQTNNELLKQNSEFREALARLDSIKIVQTKILNLTESFLDDKVSPILKNDRTIIDSMNNVDIEDYVKRIQTRLKKVEESGNTRPSIKPLIGVITRKFDEKIPEDGTLHKGVDIASILNDPIYATAPGLISKTDDLKDLGNTIVIDHGNGLFTTYGHLNRISVKVGDLVKRGQTIGTVGMTGNATGPHLHYEVIKDKININPEDYFF